MEYSSLEWLQHEFYRIPVELPFVFFESRLDNVEEPLIRAIFPDRPD